MEPTRPTPHWIGSVLSVVFGISVCYLPFWLFWSHASPGLDGLFPPEFPLVVASVVYAVAFLPLYLLIPAESPLWRWRVCTLSGVAGGTAAGCVAGFILVPTLPALPFIIPFALVLGGPVGGAACLFASLTAPFFRRLRRFDPAPAQMMQRLKRKYFELSGQ